MTRRTPEQWQALFTEQAASGLSVTAFCRDRGINPNYFSLRRKQLAPTGPAPDSAFIPVALTGSGQAPCVDIVLGETLCVRVPLCVSPTWLAALVCALRG
jgi:hypothetical protein